MSTSIHITAYSGINGAQHGGVRRSAQLSRLAVEERREIIPLPGIKNSLRKAGFHPFVIFKAFWLLCKLGLSRFTFRGLAIAYPLCVWLLDLLKDNNSNDVIWIEVAPGKSMIVSALLAVAGKKFVAYPHNVEFLVPSQVQNCFSSPENEYFIERFVYLSASRVITISLFDSAIIRSLGVEEVSVLPYVPVGCFRDELLKIRGRRSLTRKDGVLILGTVDNVPTREGIRDLLDLIMLDSFGIKYMLAGYGTEVFKDSAPLSVNVIGSVSNEIMADLLTHCKCLLINHPQSSGMLTRIVEAEFVGISVYILSDYIQADDPSLQITTRISSLRELAEALRDGS